MSSTVSCGSCGGQITFKTRFAVQAVCPYCSSLVIRKDAYAETLGERSVLPPDFSPLQIGATGEYDGKRFELVGMLKMGWERGFWNEWLMLYTDDSYGWLAEAQGCWYVLHELTPLAATMKDILSAEPGQFVEVEDLGRMTVADIKECQQIGSAGELPFTVRKGETQRSIDLSGDKATFATAEFPAEKGQAPRLYGGHVVQWEDLHLKNLKEVPGWKLA